MSQHIKSFNLCQITSSLVTIIIYHQPFGFDSYDQLTNYLSNNLPTDESIMEDMSVEEHPWEYFHHRSSFFPKIQIVHNKEGYKAKDRAL